MTDLDYMKIAINNAKKAYDLDEVPIGCVIVRENVIISSAYNRKEIDNIATYHAEILAINEACSKLNTWHLEDCVLYTTVEPCMMCMGAILYEEFDKLVYAATLQDSNDTYCPEVITNIDELAKYSKDRIEIVKELHREDAIKILKERGKM